MSKRLVPTIGPPAMPSLPLTAPRGACRLLSGCCLLVCLAGCQSYARRPLDARAHAQAWSSRSPAAAEVAAYARSLADADGTPAAYDPSDGLTLAEAEAVALFFNPSLRSARLKARGQAAGAAEAGRWEDPSLSIDAERILASVDEPWVLGGRLGLTLPLSGRLGLEKALASADADTERLRAYAAERELLAGLRRQWLEWSSTLLQVELVEALAGDLSAVARQAQQLRQAGELDPTDERLFRIEQARRHARLAALRAEAARQELSLKAQMGLAPHAEVRLVPSLGVPAPIGDGTIDAHPDLLIARAEYESAERTLALEVRRQYPDLSIGGGLGVEEGDERALFGASLPLPLWNANRRAIAEARAAREAAGASAEATFERLAGQLAEARATAQAASQRLATLESDLIPLVDQQIADARRLGRLGDATTLLLLESFQTAYETKLEVLEARLDLARANARLLELTVPRRRAGTPPSTNAVRQ